jgi:hypothetical protein
MYHPRDGSSQGRIIPRTDHLIFSRDANSSEMESSKSTLFVYETGLQNIIGGFS